MNGDKDRTGDIGVRNRVKLIRREEIKKRKNVKDENVKMKKRRKKLSIKEL
jgi:hypothetical protein